MSKVAATLAHGWLFWIAWGIFGFMQIVSVRYLKKYWKLNMWIHRISGTFILLITIGMGILGIRNLNWELSGREPHYVIGLIIFFSVLFIALGGIYARSMTRRLEWKTKTVLMNKIGHKVSLFSQSPK